jgi:hypothetical protein
MLAHAAVLFHFGGEEKLGSFVPLRPSPRGKNALRLVIISKALIFSKRFCRLGSMA